MPYLRIPLALLLVLLLPACGLLPEEEDKTKDWSASKFYSEASAELADANYEQAIRYYEMLEARYPFGRYAMQSQLDVAYAYYKYDEPESAIAAADRFIKLNPRNPHVDYAYYLKGLVNFNRNIGFFDRFVPFDASQRDPGAARQSFDDFGALVRRFPESKYAEDARQRMVFLRNNLAQHEVNVADYYMRRGAYVAAANRAKNVLENHPRTPAVRSALQILAAAYDEMGMDDLAADTRRVLAYNEEQGTFAEFDAQVVEKSLGRQVWDFLELDKN
jgi:outer membrane protein assembly factor BamD